MATENVSKLVNYVQVGARADMVSVSKVVIYAIVNGATPPPPPTPTRRARVALIYGKTAADS